MQYSLPDIRDEGAYIQSLDSDAIYKARDHIKSHYESVLRIMDDALANQWESTCSICERWGYAYKDIPANWLYIAGSNTLLCEGCLGRWAERFELPELSRDLELPENYEQDSSVPEDTTRGGQTDFGLI